MRRFRDRRLRPHGMAAALAWAALIFWLSSQATVGDRFRWFDFPMADKVAHAALFAILTLLLRWAGLKPLASLIVASLYGVTDELHQLFVAGRQADPLDWLADTLGAGLVLTVVGFLTPGTTPHDEPVQ